MPQRRQKISDARFLASSLETPRPCYGTSCICLTYPERQKLRRVFRLTRAAMRRMRRERRALRTASQTAA